MQKIKLLLSIVLIAIFIIGCSVTDVSEQGINVSVNDSNESEENSKNEISFNTQYEIVDCYNGYFIATTNNGELYGMLNQNGDVVIDFNYAELTFGEIKNNDIVYATNNNGQGVLDFNGNVVISLEYNQIKAFDKYNTYTFAKKTMTFMQFIKIIQIKK